MAIAAICPPALFGAAGRVARARLPLGFTVLDSIEASASQTAEISMRLGGKIDKLSNIFLSVHGTGLQVNVIVCPTAADTEKIHKSVVARKNHPAFCHTFERTVVEFVGDDMAVAIMAGFELGYKPKPKNAAYNISFEAAEAAPLLDGELTRYTFQNLPEKSGVPSVSISASVRTAAATGVATTRKIGPELLQATEFWPSDDPEIISPANRITIGCNTEQQKVIALLKWLRPGVYVRFAGPVIGSRYGVKKTLTQGSGYCWDFSDCFITFCRALKIPSRQVAGWLYGQSGHIWAEVLVENNQWRQVDPTGGGIVECGIYHIAYLTSEDGKMPILYLSQPKIEFLNY